MADDERNMIDVAQDVSKNWTGTGTSHDQMLGEFELYGFRRRADILDQLDTEYRNTEVDDREGIGKFYDLSKLRKAMQSKHHTLRKAGR
jgi:hypothetical protein